MNSVSQLLNLFSTFGIQFHYLFRNPLDIFPDNSPFIIIMIFHRITSFVHNADNLL